MNKRDPREKRIGRSIAGSIGCNPPIGKLGLSLGGRFDGFLRLPAHLDRTPKNEGLNESGSVILNAADNLMNDTEAEAKVQDELQRLAGKTGIELTLLRDKTVVRDFGWVFFYHSARYVQTGSLRDRLAGNGPIIVDRKTGLVTAYGSKPSLDEIIARHEA
jgi:hypothetical protein